MTLARAAEPSAALVDRALELVAVHAGLVFSPDRHTSAVAAIRELIAHTHLASADELDDPARLAVLLDMLVVHESYFDRDPEQLEYLDTVVLPDLARHGERLRVWSAGCAAGEEAYTLAFLLADRGLEATILGTDLSRRALARARTGTYRPWAVRNIRSASLRHLDKLDDGWQVPDRFLGAVRFARHNLIEDPYPEGQHLILCRNVLIYMRPAAVAVIAHKLASALAPGGWLLVGPSDPRLDEVAPLTATITERGVAYRRRTEVAPVASTPAPIAPIARPGRTARPAPAAPPAPARPATAPDVAITNKSDLAIADAVRRLADRGKEREAMQLLAPALALDPTAAELHFLHAVLLAPTDVTGALAALDRVRYLAPDEAAGQLFAASLLRGKGDVAGARRAYRAALSIAARLPDDAPIAWTDLTAAGVDALARAGLA